MMIITISIKSESNDDIKVALAESRRMLRRCRRAADIGHTILTENTATGETREIKSRSLMQPAVENYSGVSTASTPS